MIEIVNTITNNSNTELSYNLLQEIFKTISKDSISGINTEHLLFSCDFKVIISPVVSSSPEEFIHQRCAPSQIVPGLELDQNQQSKCVQIHRGSSRILRQELSPNGPG